jgi:adenylate cyclase
MPAGDTVKTRRKSFDVARFLDRVPEGVRRVFAFIFAPFFALYRHLVRLRTEGYPPDTQRRLKIVNVISVLIVITNCIYAFQLAMSGDEAMRPVVYLNLVLAVVVAAVPFLHRFNDVIGCLLLVVAEFAALIGFAAYFGRTGGNTLQYVVAAAAPFVIFERRRLWLVILIVVSALLLHLYTWFTFPRSAALLQVNDEMLRSLYIQGAVTTFGLIAACVYYAFNLAEKAKAETDAVLRNVLPDSVVERLKAEPGRAIADGFASASVLFADIAGFVSLARALGPERTVDLLSQLVSAFDDLAQKHGVEKIKTIGDAYMVASGVPIPRDDHAVALASFALDMTEAARRISVETGIELNLRMGMASGPMMAGVIGTRKFSYDVWGDPVNLASRLESASAPGRVLICPGCRDLLKDRFDLEPHGTIEIKGVGPQETWFIGRRKQSA